MKIKSLVLVIGALAILALIVMFANRPDTSQAVDSRVDKTIVDGATIDKAAKLKVTDQGKTVELTKKSEGNWIVSSYYDFPADFQKLSQFAGDLTGTKIQRLVTANPEKLSRLEFKDTQIALLDASDKPLWVITLGKNAESGGGRFLRFGDEAKGYLVAFSAYLDTDSKNWVNSSLVPLKNDDVSKIEIALPDGSSFVATRAKKEDPFAAEKTPNGQKVNTTKLTSILSNLTSLRFSDTTAETDEKAVAAKAHDRTVKLTTFDGKTTTIALGRKPEEKVIKPPTAGPDGKSGPAALGSLSDLTKKEEPAKEGSTPQKNEATQPLQPVTETIPAGPTYAKVSTSDASAPVNGMMQKRAFEVMETALTDLPTKTEDLFEPIAPAPSVTHPVAIPPTSPDSAAPKPSDGQSPEKM